MIDFSINLGNDSILLIVKFALLFCLIGFSGWLNAQQENTLQRHKFGFIYGYGAHSFTNITYNYEVHLFHFQYYIPIVTINTLAIELLFQPQYNTTRYKYSPQDSSFSRGFEYGLNIAALIRKNIYDDLISIYSFIGAGPHYISGAPRRQSAGFVFSDNLFIGCTLNVGKATFADLRFGIRHLSIAGIKEPNAGVKNTIIKAGLMFLF